MSSFIPYEAANFDLETSEERAKKFKAFMLTRRSVRDYSAKHVPEKIIRDIIITAASAPSGANKQPWTFCIIQDPVIKKQIRHAAEKEEYLNYHGRMSDTWLEDLKPLGTDENKEFLEVAPYLIVVLKQSYTEKAGKKLKNYYVQESVGIACGFLVAAIHQAGLVTLTHTPSPMNFLQKILNRPANEKPFLLLPVGYPKEDAMVPEITKKTEKEYAVWI